MEAIFHYQQSAIHYHLYGTGPLLLCLHGYNHTTRSFGFLKKHLEHRFTVLAIDLPYHGQTEWKEQRSFTPDDLHQIVLQLHPEAENGIHLLGYSMGGRVCLGYFQRYPATVKSIALVAPDGLNSKLWYKFVTQTRVGNRILHNSMHNPVWLHRLIRTTARYKLAPKGLTSVATYFMNDEQGRIQLYHRWTSLGRFRPIPRIISRLLTKYGVPVNMLFGKSDAVISWKKGVVFQKICPKWIHYTVIRASHYMMSEQYAQEIIKLLPA